MFPSGPLPDHLGDAVKPGENIDIYLGRQKSLAFYIILVNTLSCFVVFNSNKKSVVIVSGMKW